MPWELRILQQRLEGLSNQQIEAWTPAIDVYETESSFVVTAELPGLGREQVDLAFEDRRLTIRGLRCRSGRRGGRPALPSGRTRLRLVHAHLRVRRQDRRRAGHGGPGRRRADGHVAEAHAAARAQDSRPVTRPAPHAAAECHHDETPDPRHVFVAVRLRRRPCPHGPDAHRGRRGGAAAGGLGSRAGGPGAEPGRRPGDRRHARPHARRPTGHPQRAQHLVDAGRPHRRTRRLPTTRSSGTSSATTARSATASDCSRASVRASWSRPTATSSPTITSSVTNGRKWR